VTSVTLMSLTQMLPTVVKPKVRQCDNGQVVGSSLALPLSHLYLVQYSVKCRSLKILRNPRFRNTVVSNSGGNNHLYLTVQYPSRKVGLTPVFYNSGVIGRDMDSWMVVPWIRYRPHPSPDSFFSLFFCHEDFTLGLCMAISVALSQSLRHWPVVCTECGKCAVCQWRVVSVCISKTTLERLMKHESPTHSGGSPIAFFWVTVIPVHSKSCHV
jgi:hypothetical protein